ncbi:hypothetical protein MZT66_28000, partial [Escherichia coli]
PYNVPLYALQFISPFASGLSVGQTRVIAVSFPSMRYVLTQSLNFPRAFVVVGYKVKDVTDVHGADEPIDFHEPDWHGGQCQSGIWTTAKVNFTTSTYNIGKNTRNLSIGVHAYCSWTYLNGAPFGGFQQVYSDQNKVWYVNNYAWGNYESGGTITVTCLNLPGAGI